MSAEHNEYDTGRRGFLRGAAITALAATAAGAGATSLINKPTAETTVSVLPEPAVQTVQTAVPAILDSPTEALSQLANLQAENVRLQAALTTAQQQIDTLHQSNTSTTSQTDLLQGELDHANQQLSVQAGLLALYEQLEEIELKPLFENGVTAVSDTLTDLIADLPTLEEGIQAGEAALNTFEAQIPLVQNGRFWLQDRTSRLSLTFTSIEKMLEKAVDQVRPFFDMLHDWFENVKKWLPFGIGQQAADTMQAITGLLLEVPEFVNGLQANVTDPLNQWLDDDPETLPIQQNLVTPIRHNVLHKANLTNGKTKQLETVFRTQVAEPAETAVNRRQAINQLIAAYRQQHNL